MTKGKRYEVQTRWGWFSLDEGSYQDYLAGKLWINWNPGKPVRPGKLAAPSYVSEEALQLRTLAAGSDAHTVAQNRFGNLRVELPYREFLRDASIEELGLSVRASNGLMRAGADTFGRLYTLMERENGLSTIRNLGVKSIREITIQFFNVCYARLSETEKAVWWQDVLDRAAAGDAPEIA